MEQDPRSEEEIYSECIYECTTKWLADKGPKFYHIVASRWNWDEGLGILDWIVSQDDCDAGTAQMVFWSTEPFYYSEDIRKEDGSFGGNREAYQLALKIARLWEDGFYSKWAYSEATAGNDGIGPIVGTRKVNDELTIPAGLDDKRHGAHQDRPASSQLSDDGIEFNEGIPESVWLTCLKRIDAEPVVIEVPSPRNSEPHTTRPTSPAGWVRALFSRNPR